MRRDCFQGMADPTRREIIILLSKKDLSINKIVENFDVSRPAISKHIKILEECDIVKIKTKGRERYCSINPKPFQEVSEWLNYFNSFWDNKLDALKNFMENENDE